MSEVVPMNEYVLVKVGTEEKAEGKKEIYFGENKDKPKEGIILAFSKECKNKNFEVGKKVKITRYEMIPNGDSEDEFFVSEKAIIAMF